MSVFVLYAVVPAGRLPPPAGTTGRAARTAELSEGSVALVYEERDAAPAPSRPELVDHGRVVEAIAGTGPVLPVRFGTVLEDLDEARELLRTRESEWTERLRLVAGHVEVLVHAYDDRAPRPSPPAAGAGREYLMSRAAARRHTDTMFDELAAVLGPHCREMRRLPATDEVRVACLVPSGGSDELRASLQAWADAAEGRRATTTGPWPPFTFAEEDRS